MLQNYIRFRSKIFQNTLLLLVAGLLSQAPTIHAQYLKDIAQYLKFYKMKEKMIVEKNPPNNPQFVKIEGQIIYNGKKVKKNDLPLLVQSTRNIATLLKKAKEYNSNDPTIAHQKLIALLDKEFYLDKIRVWGFEVDLSSFMLITDSGKESHLEQNKKGILTVQPAGQPWHPQDTTDKDKLVFSIKVVSKDVENMVNNYALLKKWLKKWGIITTVVLLTISVITYIVVVVAKRGEEKGKKEKSAPFFKRMYNKLFKRSS